VTQGDAASRGAALALGIQELSVAAALERLQTGVDGLTSAEAQRRLRRYGVNRIEKIARTPAWVGLLRQFTQLFSVILWIAAGLAFFAEWNSPGQGMARIGYAVIAVIVINGVFSFAQEFRVERTLAALQDLLPRRIRAVRDGKTIEIPAELLTVGDIVVLDQGDDIPADCRLIDGFAVKVNNATVTGESIPKARDSEPSRVRDLASSGNILLAGASLVAGNGKCLVFATGSMTEFGKIAHLSQTSAREIAPLRKELSWLSKFIGGAAVSIGVIFVGIGLMASLPFWQVFIFAIGIIVAMVPEGLLTTLTLSLILAAKRLSKQNVLIRHLTSVETLGATSVICTDKTGTLTENRMEVREVLLGRNRLPASSMEGSADLAEQYGDFFRSAQLCHELRKVERKAGPTLVGDPSEIALVKFAERVVSPMIGARRTYDLPFDADRMRQSVVYATDAGARLYCKGAPEAVLPLCTHVIDAGSTRPLSAETRAGIARAQEEMARKGLRVLAISARRPPLSCTTENLETDLVFQGLVGLHDPPRPEVPGAIRKCQEAGIRVIMVTGDHPQTAVAVAREIGLIRSNTPTVISGSDLENMSARQLEVVLDADEIMFARVTAAHKMRIVEALKRKKLVVAVTGDGVNDAPALKTAHIGVAMGLTGTDVAKAAADMILLDDNFASLVSAVEEGRTVFQNIRKFLTYILVHNVAELVPYLAFVLFPIPLPLTPIQALAVDMGTDSLTALGLGIEKSNPRIMKLPPRGENERLMDRSVAVRSYLFLGALEAVAGMAAFFFVLFNAGWEYGQHLAANDPVYQSATTACLSAIIVMQIVNVYVCRSAVRSTFSMRLLDNPVIVAGVALEIALLLIFNYSPWAHLLLQTMPVPLAVWPFLLPFAGAMLGLEELRKSIMRAHLRNADRLSCGAESSSFTLGGKSASSE
jgi:sodium/potassium-transporting ATPase subunit alpha